MDCPTTARPPTRCRSSRRARRTSPRPSSSRGRASRSRSVARRRPLAGVPVRIYEPDGARGTVAYFHGGGWVVGSLELVDAVCRALALDARRARGQHRLPARARAPVPGRARGRAAPRPARCGADVVAGDRAGGNLAAVVARQLRDRLKLQLLIYPVTDAGAEHAVLRASSASGYGLTAAAMQRFWELYLDGADGLEPDASPLRATDLAGVAARLRAHRRATTCCATRARPTRPRSSTPASRDARAPEGTIHGFWRWQKASARLARRRGGRCGAPRRARLDTGSPAARYRRWHDRTRSRPRSGTRSPTWPRSSRRSSLIERGEGVWVYDADDRRYLDATASLWYANLGHGRAEIADAVARADAQARGLLARSATSPTARPTSSASALAARAPMDDARVFLASGGGDAIDTAAKIARRHFIVSGQPERVHLISRTQGYHGTHGFGTSHRRDRGQHDQLGPAGPAHLDACPFDSLPALEAEIRARRARPGGRVLLRAGDRRRRRAAAARGLHRGRRRPVRRARHPARDRLRDLRLRPARHVVRRRALGGRAGPDLITFAKGVTVGLPAARRRRRLRRGRRAVLRRARRPDAPPRRHLRRPSDRAARPRWRCSTSTSARTSSARGRELERPLLRRAGAARRPSGRRRGPRRPRLPRRRRAVRRRDRRRPGRRRAGSPPARARPACSCGRCSAASRSRRR